MSNKLVVANRGWAETIPEWLLDEVRAERLVYGLADIMKGGETVGDAETVLYLYTEALTQPMSSENTNIYLYLTAKVMQKREMELPDFLKEALDRGLTDYEQYILKDIQRLIYTKRGGEIEHPLLDAMREIKKIMDKREERKEKSLFEYGGENGS